MRNLFPALLSDVIRRCDLLDRRLDAVREENPWVEFQVAMGHEKSQEIRVAAERALAGARDLLPALNAPEARREIAEGEEDPFVSALRYYHRAYDDLSKRIGFCERFVLTPVEHHNSRLTRVCQALTKEIRWPDDLGSSLVGAYADSEDGSYWTIASLRVVGAPVGEAACLLGLPDLCHELGHHLAEAHRDDLTGEFDRLFAQHKAEMEELLAPQLHKWGVMLDQLVERWSKRWVYEFLADIIGAHLAGPEFGWQHIRLCASNPRLAGSDEFSVLIAESHPHDDVRMFAIAQALRSMGCVEEAEELDRMWHEYLETAMGARVRGHRFLYPDDLILELVRSTLEGCRRLGIRRFDEEGTADGSGIVPLMRDAWRRFRDDPSGYSVWERGQLDALWARLAHGDAS
jgi:hypothetical protein